jgi:hypothetical protein
VTVLASGERCVPLAGRPERVASRRPTERPKHKIVSDEHARPVPPLLQLPPETAWLVPLLLVGLLLSGIVALVALHFVRRLAEPTELRSRVDSLEDEVAELRESESEERAESQSNAD